MAITEKGAKWEWKNSWFCLLFILFPINYIPFFMMYARVPKTKYLIKGLVCVLLVLLSVISIMLNRVILVFIVFLRITASVLGWFIDRPSFLRALEEKEKQSAMRSFMTGNTEKAPPRVYTPESATAVNSVVTDNLISSPSVNRKIDVNTATEQEFSEITILNVIDIKKIMQYRDEHGGFSTKDEFYASFEARPHIIAKLDGIILINKTNETPTRGTVHSSRRIDL